MQKHLIPLLFILIVFSCKNKEKTNTVPEIASVKTTTPEPILKKFYKRFEGTIAGKPVVMNITRYNDHWNINYSYTEKGETIFLYQNPEVAMQNDTLQFIEISRQFKSEESAESKINIVIAANTVKGLWISGDGKKRYPVNLSENYPQGSYMFSVTGVSDSMEYRKFKEDTPVARTTAVLLEPTDKIIQASWYTDTIKSVLLGIHNNSFTVLQAAQQSSKNFLQDYKNEADTMMADFAVDSGTHYFLNYEDLLYSNILYNDKGFTVLCSDHYSYTGGAHGINYTNLLCFDMQNKQLLKLSDIILIDPAKLQLRLEKNFRIQYGLKPKDSLTEVLFENKLPPTDNFYITHKGIGFIYQPYEVAAYAVGNVSVWIPYTDLKGYIVPQFASRMGL